MISPSNGQIVWYTPAHDHMDATQHDPLRPLAAMIVHVWGDRMVNLAVFNSDGHQTARTSVILLQDDDPKPKAGRFCEWMPFQLGQARKTEEAQERAAR